MLKKVCEKEGGQRSFPGAAAGGAGMGLRPTKRSREAMLEEVSRGAMSEESLAAKLTLGVTGDLLGRWDGGWLGAVEMKSGVNRVAKMV